MVDEKLPLTSSQCVYSESGVPIFVNFFDLTRMAVTLFALLFCGCNGLSARAIPSHRYNISPDFVKINSQPIERGTPRPVIDTVGWVVGIPSKLLLWNRRVENHSIGVETEARVAEYLEANNLQHIKVRLNQYRPLDDWKRLTKNKSVAWPWRYTLGTLSVLGETILPGRIVGGDHYNPFTHTVHLYSDLPSIALHEAAHGKDFSRREYPGTYAATYLIPVVPLYHESVASRDVMAYVAQLGDRELIEESHRILYPAYGTYVGSAVASFTPPVLSTPLTIVGAAAGHWEGRRRLANLTFPADQSFPEVQYFPADQPMSTEQTLPSEQMLPATEFTSEYR